MDQEIDSTTRRRMLLRIVRHITFVTMLSLTAACGGEERATGDQRSEHAVASAARLDPARIAELTAEYPRLGEEPLPAPRPSPDADPADVPEHLSTRVLQTVLGDATFYANKFEGRRTASGIPFRQNQMVAAHRAFPFGTILRVTNVSNSRSVNVRVVDRGPFGTSAHARRTVLDLSRRAAERLGYVQQGRTRVKVEVLEWGSGING